jgi:hypothetical protein
MNKIIKVAGAVFVGLTITCTAFAQTDAERLAAARASAAANTRILMDKMAAAKAEADARLAAQPFKPIDPQAAKAAEEARLEA